MCLQSYGHGRLLGVTAIAITRIAPVKTVVAADGLGPIDIPNSDTLDPASRETFSYL